MRIRDLIIMGRQYLVLACIIIVAIAVLFFLGYYVIYRKILHGRIKIGIGKIIWLGVLLIYLFVVAGATLFSRGGYYGNGMVSQLFSSYREAYILQKSVLWRNLILNYLMFVPLGILLPIGIKQFSKPWHVYVCGFVLSFLIETTQLVLHRGIFEPDDLFANTVGCMIGYGIYNIFRHVVCKDKKEKARKFFALQLPLIAACSVFTVLFVCYAGQELGNNPNQAYENIQSSAFEVDGKSNFENEDRQLTVYRVKRLSVEEAITKGRDFFASIGTKINDSRTDIYDESVLLYDSSGMCCIWIDYMGGSLRYTNFDMMFSEDGTDKASVKASETDVRAALSKVHVNLPPEAVFLEEGNGRYLFRVDVNEQMDVLNDGFLECKYSAETGIAEFDNHILLLERYKTYPAISTQEAFNKLRQGDFCTYLPEGFAKISVEGVRIGYSIDTKGFYQPDYCFDCIINGENSTIRIPALR